MGELIRQDDGKAIGPVDLRELPTLIPKLQARGPAGERQAAGLWSIFVVSIVAKLEQASLEKQGLSSGIYDGYPLSTRAVHLSLVRFARLHSMLEDVLTACVWQRVLRDTPVQVGPFIGTSYIDLAKQWANQWAAVLYPLELEDAPPTIGDGGGADPEDLLQITEDAWDRWHCVAMVRQVRADVKEMAATIHAGVVQEGFRHAEQPVTLEAMAALIFQLQGGQPQIQQPTPVLSRNTSEKYRVVYAAPMPTKPMQQFAEKLAENMSRDKIEIGREIAGTSDTNDRRAKSLVSQFNDLLKKNRVRFEVKS